jgi:hypothetical protein
LVELGVTQHPDSYVNDLLEARHRRVGLIANTLREAMIEFIASPFSRSRLTAVVNEVTADLAPKAQRKQKE